MKRIFYFLIILTWLENNLYSQSGQADIFRLNNDADMLVLDGEYYSAIEKYKTVLEINPNYIDSVKGLAQAYFYLGEFEEANRQIKSARIFDKNSIELMGLEARILLAMGNIEEAEKKFRFINSREPNNINAYFGFAEIALVTGKYSESTGNYLDILSISPANKKALLSLILLSDYQGRYEESEKYLSEVLRLYSGDYFCLYIAARHYLLTGDFIQAEKKVRDSIRIKPDFMDSSVLYARLLLADKKYEAIPSVLEPFYRKKNNSIVSYSLGKAYEKTSDYDTALKYYAESFRINPDDEISRFALENLIKREKDYKDPLRSRYSEYHFSRGKGLEDRNYTQKALDSYRRGLLIDPYSVKGRLQYANLFLKSGFRGKYLDELRTLPETEKNKQYISDLIEIHESISENTTSYRWNINQSLVAGNSFGFNLFYMDSINMLHPAGEETAADVFSDIINHSERIRIINKDYHISSYSDAFSISRNSEEKCDYFIILRMSETERAFGINASLYSAYTGSLIREYKIYTTGNSRIWETLNKLAQNILSDSAVEGSIIKIDFDRGIINLGKFDNVKNGDVLNIVKKDKAVPDRTSIGKTYPASEILGTFVVTGVDENISEGIIKNRDVFNLVNHGDMVFPVKDNAKKDEKTSDKGREYELFNIITGIK